MNQIGEMLEHGTTSEQVKEIIDALAEYAQFHFDTEELLMAKHGLDDRHVQIHRLAHGKFLQQVVRMRGATSGDLVKMSGTILSFFQAG